MQLALSSQRSLASPESPIMTYIGTEMPVTYVDPDPVPLKGYSLMENYISENFEEQDNFTQNNYQQFLTDKNRSWSYNLMGNQFGDPNIRYHKDRMGITNLDNTSKLLNKNNTDTPIKNIVASSDKHTQRINQGSDGEDNMLNNYTGLREDGRLSDIQGKIKTPVDNYDVKSWSLHMEDPNKVKKFYETPVQVDERELNKVDEWERTRYEKPKDSKEKVINGKYDVKKKVHPSDEWGIKVNGMIEVHKGREKIGKNKSKKEEKYENKPIIINVSCNQNIPKWAQTPNINNLDIKTKCQESTLSTWYNENDRDFFLANQKWKSNIQKNHKSITDSMIYPQNNQFNQPIGKFLDNKINTQQQIGAPYAPYISYANVNGNDYRTPHQYNFFDPAKRSFYNK